MGCACTGSSQHLNVSIAYLTREASGSAKCVLGKTRTQCFYRWHKVLNPEVVKGSWTEKEDNQLRELVKQNGARRWAFIAKSLPGRVGKQCRERWYNHLDPTIKKDAWTIEEESVLARCHEVYGNKWTVIARYLPGRTDNSIKNHWNCHMKETFASRSTGCMMDKSETDPEFCSSDISSQILKVKSEEQSPGEEEHLPGRRPLLRDGTVLCPTDLVLGGFYSSVTKSSKSSPTNAVFCGDDTPFGCSLGISLPGAASGNLITSPVQASPSLTCERPESPNRLSLRVPTAKSCSQMLYPCIDSLRSGPTESSGGSSTSAVDFEALSIMRRTTSKKMARLISSGSVSDYAFKTKTGVLYLQKPGISAAIASLRKCLEHALHASDRPFFKWKSQH
ncbi:hypothetical protein CDL15_Pgr017888 [Punica granatum]|uniref:Uncharacterized protein n=1 Tax=Punica granatum TaxID=22663 RepID=A0A218WGQ9_PUNGR|nr:hypothetical protein CDL15_Pgr017888 [Punica granatum]